MQRRWSLTLLLFSVVLALAAVAWLEPGGDDAQPARIAPHGADLATELRIQRRDAEALVFVRQAHGWQLVAPLEVHASGFHVEQVLRLLELGSQASYGLDEIDRQQVDLDPPRVRIRIDDRELLLGASHPIGNRRYVQYGERIHLVREGVMPLIEGPWWNFIDRHLVLPGELLQAVRTPHYHLERDAGRWVLRAGALSDALAPEELARLWEQAEALLVRPVRREAGDDASVTLYWAAGGKRLLRLDEQRGELRLTDPQRGLAYVIDGRLRAVLVTGRLAEESANAGLVTD